MGVQTQTFRTSSTVATKQKVYKLTSPITVNDEFTQVIDNGAKKILIYSTDLVEIKFTLNSGESNTKPINIFSGCSYSKEGLNLVGETAYFRINSASKNVTIEVWT